MKTLIIYDSTFGNTKRIAQAIAQRLEAFGSVRLISASESTAQDIEGTDLMLVGGPTHRHGASETMETFLEGVPRGALHAISAAAFDTRYQGSAWITGSAAARIARTLKRAGARLVVEPESFFMQKDVPPQGEKRRHELEHLEPGEEERAAAWAAKIATALEPAALPV